MVTAIADFFSVSVATQLHGYFSPNRIEERDIGGERERKTNVNDNQKKSLVKYATKRMIIRAIERRRSFL